MIPVRTAAWVAVLAIAFVFVLPMVWALSRGAGAP